MTAQIAIVTGATSGIGLGIAQAFAKKGWHLVVNGLEPQREIQGLLDELELQSGNLPLYSQADLSTPEGCRDLVKMTLEAQGRVDVVVNNAGIQHVAPLPAFPQERWEKIINLNLAACFYISQAALPGMYEQKWGRLIHIASAHGLVGSPQKAAYVAAKHGVLGLSKVIALEAAGSGVTSNCICPGWVLTPLVEQQIQADATARNVSFAQAQQELLLKKQPSGAFATPEQIGELAVFLSSDAAAQITGSALSVDGGWTAQ